MKKKLFASIGALLLCLSLSSPAFADDTVMAEEPPVAEASSEIQPLAEETEWVVRNYNGRIQMRLWSCTYGKWLTDWIDMGPAPEG